MMQARIDDAHSMLLNKLNNNLQWISIKLAYTIHFLFPGNDFFCLQLNLDQLAMMI